MGADVMAAGVANSAPPSLDEARDEGRMPARIRALPRCPTRRVPVPWFVAWVGGVPEFRAADRAKWVRAVRDKLCWVCGEPLGRYMTFVIGPMCGLNRTSAEPPSHLDCARWSARNCPFLSRPLMDRREGGMPGGAGTLADGPGHAIARNPGVTLLWTTRDYRLFPDGKGQYLIRIGDATGVEWWAEGRSASREEVGRSVETGLPALLELARAQDADEGGGAAEAELYRLKRRLEAVYP
jgi:hypothetical protein